MVEKLEELERLYKVSRGTCSCMIETDMDKAVVKAATVILQYQAFALRL